MVTPRTVEQQLWPTTRFSWDLIWKNGLAFLLLLAVGSLENSSFLHLGPSLGIWLTYGISVSLLLISGFALLPAIAGGIIADAIGSFGWTDFGLLSGFIWTLIALFGTWLTVKWAGKGFLLKSLKGVVGLTLGAGLLAPFAGGIIEFVLSASLMEQSIKKSFYWGISSFTAASGSALCFIPLIIAIYFGNFSELKKELPEFFGLLIIIILIGIGSSTPTVLANREAVLLGLLMLPVMVTATLWLGPLGAAIIILVANHFAVFGAVFGYSPLAQPTIEDSLVALQAGIFVVNGTLAGMGAVVRERHDTQKALRESVESFQALFNATFEGLLVHREGRILNVNDAFLKMGGYSWSDVIGKHVSRFVAPEDWERVLDQYIKGNSNSYEVRILRADGSHCPAEVAGRDFSHQGGNTRVITLWDLTRRKENERRLKEQAEQLRQTQKMEAIGQLAGGIAHDFNNLLVGILGFGELLKQRIGENPSLQRPVDSILRSANRAADLTQHLLNFSRKKAMVMEPVNLKKLIGGIEGLMEHCLDSSVTVKVETGATRHTVLADPALLESAILNLAINAGDAMPNGGQLVISTAQMSLKVGRDFGRTFLEPGDYLALSIQDNGTGMDEETLNRCFEPFYTTKGIGEGTGLGLATVFGFVSSHQGAIVVESELGKGTCFTLFIPLANNEILEEETPLQSVEFVNQGNNGRVMVVDDEQPVRELLVESLNTMGFQTVSFPDGLKATDHFENDPQFVLAIVDMVMPGLGGKQTVEKLRQKNPEIPILFCTGFSEESLVMDGLENAKTRVLLKPFRLVDLVKEITLLTKGEGDNAE